MKYRAWYGLLLCVVIGFFGCQHMERQHRKVREWMKDNGKIKALCTTAFVASLVESVGGEYVDVFVLVDGQNDPHSYKLVKGDDEKFRRADVVFSSGLGLEQGTTLTRYLSAYNACAVGDAVAQLTGEALFIGPTVDPHIWMDISLWAQGATAVAHRLATVRPDLSEYFHERASRAVRKYMAVHAHIQERMQRIPSEKRYLVTTHDAFQYFCRAYLAMPQEAQSEEWKRRCIAPEGFAPESQISTQDLNAVVAYILEHGVRILFAEEGMNRDSLHKVIEVCNKKGHELFLSHDSLYSDTMGPQMTYEETMEHNAHALYEAFYETR